MAGNNPTDSKRDAITFNIASDIKASPAATRFLDEYRENSVRAIKRTKILGAFRAGQMIEECGLSPVFSFLDTENFTRLSVEQRQQLLLARMQEFMGVTPFSIPAAAPAARGEAPAASADPVANTTSQDAVKAEEPAFHEEPAEVGHETSAEAQDVPPAAEEAKAEKESTDAPKGDAAVSNPRVGHFRSKIGAAR